jgi:nitronate monooxygenase
MFLTMDIATQLGTMALVPQIVDAVKVPVIAAGGIMDARGIAAAFALGASAVQLGTAYLRCKECATTAVHRRALEAVRDDETVLTNIFTGRPARGIVNRLIRELGPIRDDVPPFPRASHALAPLRAHAEASGSGDFSPLWAGQGAAMAKDIDAANLTRTLMDEALPWIRRLQPA